MFHSIVNLAFRLRRDVQSVDTAKRSLNNSRSDARFEKVLFTEICISFEVQTKDQLISIRCVPKGWRIRRLNDSCSVYPADILGSSTIDPLRYCCHMK